MRLHRSAYRTPLVATLAVAAAAFAVVQAPAQAATVSLPLGTYTAALPLQPFPTVSSSTDPSGIGFPLTFTNTSAADGYALTHVQVNLPTGFAATGTPTVSAAGWTASVSGNTVSADASTPLNAVASGQSVLLSFSATAPTVLVPSTFTFATAASGVLGSVASDFSNTGSDPQVSVAQFANVVTCAPNQQCDTGTVGSASDTTARIVTTTGAIQDFLGLTVDQPVDAACLAISQSSGRSEELTWADIDTSRTLTTTLEIDKSVVNATPNNGAATYGICYDTGSLTKTFVDHNGHLTSVGWLPLCTATGLVARQPCITSVHKTGVGDVVITYTSPGGDPKSIGGIVVPGT